MRIAPGETLELEVVDSSGGQLSSASTVADVGRLDFSRVNPVSGPVFVEGAEPGDALKVTLLSFAPSGWGWTANIPGFGLLADEFKEPALHLWKYDAQSLAPSLFGRHGMVRLKPFTGTIGLVPAGTGFAQHRSAPACGRQHGCPRHFRRDGAVPAGRGSGSAVPRSGDTYRRPGRRRGGVVPPSRAPCASRSSSSS